MYAAAGGSSVLHPGGAFFCYACVHCCVYNLRDTERTHMFTKAIDRMATRAPPKGEWHPDLHTPFSLGEMP